MKIAIHHSEGSFSQRWIEYCENNQINYKIVNAFDTDIISQLKGYDAFFWHHHHGKFDDVIAAKNILFSLEHAGIQVFPNFKTGWHFDDKVAQKYLLEALNIPLVPSYIFYNKDKAKEWANATTYPKVFKLKGGAGSSHVKLVKTKSDALNLIERAFGKGFNQYDRFAQLKERFYKYKSGQSNLIGILKGIVRLFILPDFAKMQSSEKGYVYFQDFIKNNDCDIRVIVINNKAFAIKRMVRENDFRASGSGQIKYDHKEINLEFIKIAFDANKKLDSQCTAFDFVLDDKGGPQVVEISYGFSMHAYDLCPGFWDENLIWHEGNFNPQNFMIENLIEIIKNQ